METQNTTVTNNKGTQYEPKPSTDNHNNISERGRSRQDSIEKLSADMKRNKVEIK